MSQPETIADNLLAQHRLLLSVIHTDWATRLDHKVAAVIIERYMRKQGNARASLRYLEKATGSKRNKIIISTRRLLEHGVFHVLREGVGTRPTEYGLNFQFSSSGTLQGTSSDIENSGSLEGTPCGTLQGTSSTSSGTLQGTESSLTEAPLQGALTERDIEPAAPSAPPGSGLEGRPGAETAGDGDHTQEWFRELWKTYYPGARKGKGWAEAEKVYRKLAPDAALHAEIVESAREWYERWEEQDKPDAPRFTLAKWLERREYECEPPTAYKPKERKPRRAENDDNPQYQPHLITKRRIGTITNATLDKGIISLRLVEDAGTEWESTVIVDSPDAAATEAGQRHLAQIWHLAESPKPLENDFDLHGIRAELLAFKDGRYEWRKPEERAA